MHDMTYEEWRAHQDTEQALDWAHAADAAAAREHEAHGETAAALARALARPEAAELTRHLAYLLGQYERVIAMVRHIRMDTAEDRELHERVLGVMEEGAAPVRRVLDGERSDLVARPDAATLRDQIAAAVERTQWPSTGSDQVDHGRAMGVTDAVMAVLAEHGLVDREASDGE